jgi:hypothetical protein
VTSHKGGYSLTNGIKLNLHWVGYYTNKYINVYETAKFM